MPCIDQGDKNLGALHSRLGASPERYLRAYGFLAITDNLRTQKFTPKLNQGVEARDLLPSIEHRTFRAIEDINSQKSQVTT